MKPTIKILIWLSIFSIAMALLESAVVIYLRALYYPEEFTVALKLIDSKILFIELLRETATVVMLAGIGVLSGKNFTQRFAYFLFCFALWDIFYYIWLKILIDWPSSLFTWDVLFLIPITWLGPVLAPLICSVTMIGFSLILLKIETTKDRVIFTLNHWMLLFIGSGLILYTFVYDYTKLIFENNLVSEISTIMQSEKFITLASRLIPSFYNWPLFFIGELILILAIYLMWNKNKTLQTI
jgi:hypothetical protein